MQASVEYEGIRDGSGQTHTEAVSESATSVSRDVIVEREEIDRYSKRSD